MTEKEKIIEMLTKNILVEMAIPRSEFRDNLKNAYPIVIKHLILIITQPNNQELNHWKGEIYGNFSRFEKLKYSKKYPTKQDFMDCGMETCYEHIMDQLDSYIIEVYSRELKKDVFKISDINMNINVEKLKQLIIEYFEWCIDNMNNKTGLIDKLSAYNKMDDLINLYNKEI